MRDLVSYLTTRPEEKRMVLLGGLDFGCDMIRDICATIQLENLLIYLPGEKMRKAARRIFENGRYQEGFHAPDSWQIYDLAELPEGSPFDGESFTLLFDALDRMELLYPLAAWKPAVLLGAKRVSPVTTFDLWERFRTVSDSMHLLTWGEGRRNECLDWTRDAGSDVELSVIFPMFKIAGYLPKCIESVRAWDADYVEYLFVDDGSPDNCADIVRQYAEKDPRIKLLQKENGGCASARQYGLERAKGRYIGFIDPDDFIDESMFRKLLSRAMVGSYEISYCGYKELYEETGKTRDIPDLLSSPYKDGTVDPNEIQPLMAFLRVAIWRGIYRSEMLRRNKIHFYTDLRRFDDLPFKFEVFASAKSVVCVPEHLYYYRMARPGQDVAANDERLYVHFSIFEYLDEFVAAHGTKEMYDYLQIVKLHTHIYALQKLLPQYVKEYAVCARQDILHNMNFTQANLVYRKTLSRRDKAFFLAIMSQSPAMIRMMKAKAQSRDEHRAKDAQEVVEALEKFSQ